MSTIMTAINDHLKAKGISTSTDAEINGALQDTFYNPICALINQYEAALMEAQSVDNDLIPEKREARQASIIGMAHAELLAGAEKLSQPYISNVHDAEKELQTRTQPDETTNLDKIFNLLSVQFMHSQLSAMPEVERNKVIRSLASAGNPLILRVLEMSINPICSSDMMNIAKSRYLEAVAGDTLAIVDKAKGYAFETQRIAGALHQYSERAAKEKGLHTAYLKRNESKIQKVLSWSDAEKIKWIGEHGQSEYAKLLRGEREP